MYSLLAPKALLVQGVTHLAYHLLGPVLSPRLLVVTLHNRERLHDVLHVLAPDAVEMKECCVELAAEVETAIIVPGERRTRVAAVARERLEVVRRIDQLKHTQEDPSPKGLPRCPKTGLVVSGGRQRRKLLQITVREVDAANFLPADEIQRQRVKIGKKATRKCGLGSW